MNCLRSVQRYPAQICSEVTSRGSLWETKCNVCKPGVLQSYPDCRKEHVRRQSTVFLPKLPVPPLKQTLGRFLQVVRPLVPPDEYERTRIIADEFGKVGGQGERLQALLQKRAEVSQNWLSDWWLENAYMLWREPLVVNSSPGLSFPLQKFNCLNSQIEFAGRLICALLDYKQQIDSNSLPPDKAGAELLDMSQYKLLFGTCRIPGHPMDRLRLGCNEKTIHRHIIVSYRSTFFKLIVLDESGHRFNENDIVEQLDHIVTHECTADAPPKVGILTSENRSQWAATYKKLRESEVNRNSLDAIETGLFLICIDDPVGSSSNSYQSLNQLGQQLLHGGGSRSNSGNRWFDKTLQFVVGYNGSCGLTYEHSPAEGPPVAALMDFAVSYISSSPKASVTSSKVCVRPEVLNFDLNSAVMKDIDTATANLDRLVEDVEFHLHPFTHFGKSFPKSQKLSPDSFIQMALQLAFFKLHYECPPAYETGTLRRFLYGRTDTIRLPTVESVAFVEAMAVHKEVPETERAEKLRRAIISHKDYTAAACSGNGIDRHLLGLKLVALENGLEVPDLLQTTAYKKAMHFKLSTSQVASKYEACMMFGPMYPDCYGICYNPQENKLFFAITAFNSCPTTSAKRFAVALEESLLEMQKVLALTQKAHL